MTVSCFGKLLGSALLLRGFRPALCVGVCLHVLLVRPLTVSSPQFFPCVFKNSLVVLGPACLSLSPL